jgi:hypothetical protein
VRTLRDCTVAFADLIPAIEAKRDNMRAAASKGYATATDLADYLVRKGLPFRDAHDVVGKLVAVAIRMNCDLAELPLTTLQEGSGLVEADVLNALSLDGSVAARNHVGGTAPNQVRAAIARALAAHSQWGGTPLSPWYRPGYTLAPLSRLMIDMRTTSLVFLVILLSGCGQKGPLYRPATATPAEATLVQAE